MLTLVLLELVVLIWAFRSLGPWWTIGLLVLFAVLGTVLVRRESSRTWRAMRSAVDTGRVPGREIADAVLVLAGGLLLVLPGFLSDLLGLVLILPFTRGLGRWVLQTVIGVRIVGGAVGGPGSGSPGDPGAGGGSGPGWPPGGAGPGAGGQRPGGPGYRQGDNDIIEGEIISEDPPP